MTEQRTIELKIKRQDSPNDPPRWEVFSVPYLPRANVITCLKQIQSNPVTKDGKETTPVVWDSNCLEEVCGACTMLVNGKVRQACSALVDQLEQPIVLEPMRKFPTVRDLVVDRSFMFESLKRVKAWIPIDGSYDLGAGPRMSERQQEIAYMLSRCMTCGCCVEACPQVNERSDFIGPAVISQVRLFNLHPTGEMNRWERLESLIDKDGISGCGGAQNCVKVCPKKIQLTESIAAMARETSKYQIRKIFHTD